MVEGQKVDIYRPLISDRVGPPPVLLRVGITPSANAIVGGVPASSFKIENYVLVSALPTELQERVRTAVQAIIAGM